MQKFTNKRVRIPYISLLILPFLNRCISVKTSPNNTKFRNYLWISVCFFWLCGSIVANRIIYRLVPSPSRFEIILRPRPQYGRGIRKRSFHSENVSVHTTPEELKIATITGQFWFVWGKLRQRNHVIIVTSSFSTSYVFQMFSLHTKTYSRHFQNSSDFKIVFEKPRFHDGLVWTVGLTEEIKLRQRNVNADWT